MYYNSNITMELAEAVNIKLNLVFVVPHFAKSVFLEFPNNVVLINTSITAEALIQGGVGC